jgi:hypothetical protein
VNTLSASSIKTRALHLVIRGNEDITKMQELVLLAKKHHFNTLILMMANGVALESMPWLAKKKIWTKKDFLKFVIFAKKQEMEIIPEVKFLTHQEKLFNNYYPEFMLNKRTYNPNNQNVYEIIFPIIDELIELTGCEKFHIGHDEVVGYKPFIGKKYIEKGQKRLTATEYYNDIVKIYNYLKVKNIKTMMWGDELYSREYYPSAKKWHKEHNINFINLKMKLPKDIIICDWQYERKVKEFLSFKNFSLEGFTVYGATWKEYQTTKNFTKYISGLNYQNSGMIATTWYIPTEDKNSLVKEIIKNSGEIFWDTK